MIAGSPSARGGAWIGTAAAILLVAAPFAQVPPPGTMTQEEPADRSVSGALTLFMASRDYGSIRQLRSLMSPALRARFEHDSVPFNGKRGIRLTAFDFREEDLKPLGPAGKAARVTEPAAQPPPVRGYVATARSLWEEQGEAVELRVESLRLAQQEDGLWRVAVLEPVHSESLRFKEAIPGVTTLRQILRAWHRRDLVAARSHMSQAFLRAYEGREEDLRAIFVGESGRRHAAYQILELQSSGSGVRARVRLYGTVSGRPTPIDGPVVTVGLVKKGPPFLLDSWK